MKVFPVAYSHINIESIRAISREVGSAHSLQASDTLTPASLVSAMSLKEWKLVLENGGYELGHFYLSFYIEAQDIYSILSLSNLQLLKIEEGAYIVTSNILGWRDVVVNGLSKESSTESREVINYVMAFMRDNGFAPLFSRYKRKNLVLDGTVILEK